MDARIARTLALIDAHMDERWTIQRFAKCAGLSPSRFMHLFRRVMGVSPGQYLQERRMVRARALLEGTFLSVGEAMARVGCHDPSHFARDFRRHHGFPPSACHMFGRPRRTPPDYNVRP
jgi:AraC family transcriptional regulator, arabinose operon regulatory protein